MSVQVHTHIIHGKPREKGSIKNFILYAESLAKIVIKI